MVVNTFSTICRPVRRVYSPPGGLPGIPPAGTIRDLVKTVGWLYRSVRMLKMETWKIHHLVRQVSGVATSALSYSHLLTRGDSLVQVSRFMGNTFPTIPPCPLLSTGQLSWHRRDGPRQGRLEDHPWTAVSVGLTIRPQLDLASLA